MRTARCTLSMVLGLMACSGGDQNPPPPPAPPHVFLTAAETNVVGTQFQLTVNVSGCDPVTQIEIQQENQFIKAFPYSGKDNVITLTSGDIEPLYSTLGISVNMTLKAKVDCDDGRTNTSSGLGISFFPVKSTFERMDQPITMPDSFVAEGGVGSEPVTFIGCASTGMGLGLVRVDTMGNVMQVNTSLPFPCDYNAAISDKVNGGIRWLFQPTQGAFAFDTDLNVTGGITGSTFTVFSPGPDGNLVIWDSMQAQGTPPLYKVLYNNGVAVPGGGSTAFVWEEDAFVNGTPVVDPSSGLLFVPVWDGSLGSLTGTISIHKFNYNVGGNETGQLDLVTQEYGLYDSPVIPNVAFSPNAATVYIPYQVLATGGSAQSGVVACPASGTGTGCVQRWKSPLLDGVVTYVIPYANGSRVAAISSTKVWFLSDQDGTVLNPEQVPAVTSGQLTVNAIQPGLAADFYVLNAASGSYPTEIIAFDQAENGEVYRYTLDGYATTAQTALTIAIDDSGAAWLRVGLEQVVPLPLSAYRAARGATLPPMGP